MNRFLKGAVAASMLLLLAGTAVQSQVRYGIKGGLSLSNLWGDGVTEFEDDLLASEPVTSVEPGWVNSFTGGVFLRFDLIPDFLAFQPELLYLRSGKSWEVDDEELRAYVDYITLPVLFKLLIPLDYPLTPSAYAGPVFSYALRARTEGLDNVPDGADLGFMTGFGEDIDDAVSDFDVGLAAGLAFDIEAGPGAVVLDFRYNWGFLEVFDGQDIRNHSFQLMAGYSLGY